MAKMDGKVTVRIVGKELIKPTKPEENLKPITVDEIWNPRVVHTSPEDNERCDGRCAKDECVCPEGGWEAEADRLRIELQLARTAEQQCSGSPKHFGGCGCLCHYPENLK
jgi:hypothetical protein